MGGQHPLWGENEGAGQKAKDVGENPTSWDGMDEIREDRGSEKHELIEQWVNLGQWASWRKCQICPQGSSTAPDRWPR